MRGSGDGADGDAAANGVVQFTITPRPRSLLYAFVGVVVVESAAVHALIYNRWPLASVVLLVLNVWTLWWLWREFSAGAWVLVTPESIDVRSGRSTRLTAPRASVRSVRMPEWRDLPESTAKGYLRIAGGEDPNVLVAFEPAAEAQLTFGVRRSVSALGLRLTEPAQLVAVLNAVGSDP